MNYKNKLRFRIVFGSFMLVILFLSSCHGDCYDSEPTEGPLTLILSQEQVKDTILLIVYEDDIDLEDEYERWDVWSADFEIWLPTNRYFSIVAHYPTDSGIVKVVDGTSLKTYLNSDESSDCWHIKNDKVYLQLMK